MEVTEVIESLRGLSEELRDEKRGFEAKICRVAADRLEKLKSENERLVDLITELQEYNEAWVEDNGNLRKRNKSLAREIFEEIEKILKSSPTEIMGRAYYYKCIVDEDFAELKKKYTEDEV